MKIPLIKHPLKSGLTSNDFEKHPFITPEALKILNISAPYSVKYFVENNPKHFTKEEINLINDLIDSKDVNNQMIALAIIDSKNNNTT